MVSFRTATARRLLEVWRSCLPSQRSIRHAWLTDQVRHACRVQGHLRVSSRPRRTHARPRAEGRPQPGRARRHRRQVRPHRRSGRRSRRDPDSGLDRPRIVERVRELRVLVDYRSDIVRRRTMGINQFKAQLHVWLDHTPGGLSRTQSPDHADRAAGRSVAGHARRSGAHRDRHRGRRRPTDVSTISTP
jgi:hypothetical protein